MLHGGGSNNEMKGTRDVWLGLNVQHVQQRLAVFFYSYYGALFFFKKKISAPRTEARRIGRPRTHQKPSPLSCLPPVTLRLLDFFTRVGELLGGAACVKSSDHQGPLFLTSHIPGIGCQLGAI